MREHGGFLLLFWLFIGAAAFEAAFDWKKDLNIDSPHPMLFFSAKEINSLRIKATTTHRKISARITDVVKKIRDNLELYMPPLEHDKFTSRWNEMYGNNLCALAMYCVLFPEDSQALELAHDYMNRMAMQPSWEFTSMKSDEMPISHSLVGFATAYDFLYPTLKLKQRQQFYKRIYKATSRHFERFKTASWGRYHLQNHVLNNCVALFIGTLIVQVHNPTLESVVHYVIGHLNTTVDLLNSIVDGSLDEGVAYSTYTTRSLTMFMFLAQRHFGINYYDSNWLKNHFWYLYATVLPGYKESIGIGDSSAYWFYGPESMLVFLDHFVLRNGYGNWLASQLMKTNHTQSKSQVAATYHTEFIWYDESLLEKNPGLHDLQVFCDWGVVTLGGGSPQNTTFLSFKSGVTHGRAINNVVKFNLFKSSINGWQSFNPGHEHPDQNSFTFWPAGKPFITEAYYGPKFSFLNNVLMFSPSPVAKCFPPFEGQVGECYKWFDWLSKESETTGADIIAADKHQDFVFISGEAAKSYGKHLMLKSVYRSLLLLNSDTLIVVDHIELMVDKLKQVSAFFNMREGLLATTNDKAVLKHSNETYCVKWGATDGSNVSASVYGYRYQGEFGSRSTQLLNVSVNLQIHTTRIAYIFFRSSNVQVTSPLIENEDMNGLKVSVYIGGEKYIVSVVTAHDNPSARLNWLGHTGYATLKSPNKDFNFGSNSAETSLPSILISTCLLCGGEVLAGTLNKSSDFIVIKNPKLQKFDNFCSMKAPSLQFSQWLTDFFRKEKPAFAESHVMEMWKMKPNAHRVLFESDGVLTFKFRSINSVPNLKVVHVTRDPRAWIQAVIQQGKVDQSLKTISQNIKYVNCSSTQLSTSQRTLLHMCLKESNDYNHKIKLLAYYWAADISSALAGKSQLKEFFLLKLEDLILEPEKIAEKIFNFLGMPLQAYSKHFLLQITKSKLFRIESGEVLDSLTLNKWEEDLDQNSIHVIEQSVGTLLQEAGYNSYFK